MMMQRVDGRAVDELRPVSMTRNYLKFAEGSVMIEVGDTRVLCSASVEDKVPPFLKGSGGGWVTALEVEGGTACGVPPYGLVSPDAAR